MSDNLTLLTCQFGGGSLLIWGAIWIGGRSPLRKMKKTMNSERYIEVLEELVSSISFELGDSSIDWTYIDDNSPPHRSIRANEYKELFGIRTLGWPALSLDLNPIDNVWSLMAEVIRKRTKPGDTLINLERLLENELAEVPQTMIDTFIRSMTTRFGLVIKNNDGYIN